MKRTNLILGMLLLLVAAAVAVYTTDRSEERALAQGRSDDPFAVRGASLSGNGARARNQARGLRSRRGYQPVIDSLRVEPHATDNPTLEAQAQRVENGAHNRLQELTEGLELSEDQQLSIFPLLARSHPDYNGQLRLLGVPAGLSLIPLSRRAAEGKLTRYLDSDQKIDLEIMNLEADAWWSDVIARLEQDLQESTRAPLASQAPVDESPSPPEEDQPTPAAPTARPGSHPGSNIRDRLRNSNPR